MARRSQCSSAEDNPLNPNYLPPHYREEYRLAIDALVEHDLDGYSEFLQSVDVVDFLSRPEIEYIQSNVQSPRHIDQPAGTCLGDEAAEGSSDTYWPMHSDVDAPSLDLGWPQRLPFVGPTEITTFVNPPDPSMPSIKTQARRLIKDARLVIAVAMDIFTDVDIFADLLAATTRNVAVYILLDERNAHHFAAMVANCRVNLDQIKQMRVRTVGGTEYYCRTGKSFKGQMMERFLLIDSRAVLGGNYSFMWSFEKLHRCLAHLFLGQLVFTFDEEFRILFAQSEPLVIESAVKPVQKYSSMPDLQKTHQMHPWKPWEYLPEEGTYRPEWAGNLYEGSKDRDPKVFPLRRGGSAQMLPPQANMHPDQQFRAGAFDGNIFRKSSFGEGTPGGYYQQYLMHRQRQNVDAMDTQSTHSNWEQYHSERTGQEPFQDPHDRFKGNRYQHLDQYSDPGGPLDRDQVDNYDHVLKFLQSGSAVEMEQGSGNLMVPEGPYSQSSQRRQRLAQPYACQRSPTQLSSHEQKQIHTEHTAERKFQDSDAKKGMRDWRIHSYLSAYDDAASEDMPPLQGSDVGDDSPFTSQERLCDLEPLAARTGHRELPKMPSAVLSSRHMKPFQSGEMKNYPSDIKPTSAANSESTCTTESVKAGDGTDMPPGETNVMKDEPFQRRSNPTLQRASRLRNSLLFKSNLEQHRSLFDLAKSQEQKEEESPEVLEKNAVKNPLKKQSTIAIAEELKPVELPSINLQHTPSFMVDMNDPDNRLQFFKQLAAQRKAEAAAKAAEGIAEKPCKQLDKIVACASDGSHCVAKQEKTLEVSHHPTDIPSKTELQSLKSTKEKAPILTVHVSDSDTTLVETLSAIEDVTSEAATLGQPHDPLPQIATDAEKIELKRLQEPVVATCTSSPHSGSNISTSAQQSESQNAIEAPLGSNRKEKPCDSVPEPDKRELPVIPSAIMSQTLPNIKPVLPVICGGPVPEKTTLVETTDLSSTTSSEKAAEVVSMGAVESSETKKEFAQRRLKPTLQTASRLRNSLLFNSRTEQHRSQWENENITDHQNQRGGLSLPITTVSSISPSPESLDKETSRSQNPITPANPTAEIVKTQESLKKSDTVSGINMENIPFKKQASFTMGDKSNPLEFQSRVLQRTTTMLDLADPDSRLQFFREMSAQRKAEQAAAKSAESITEQVSEKPKMAEDTSAIDEKEKVIVLAQSTMDQFSKPSPAVVANAPQVLKDSAKTFIAQSVPASHEVKDLSENSVQSSSSSSQFANTATDNEKMELRKLQAEVPAQFPSASSASDLSLSLKDIPKEDILSCQDQASINQTSGSERIDLPYKPVLTDSSLPSLPMNASQSTHSPVSHSVRSISTVEVTREESCPNPSNKPVDSDSSSVSSSIEMSSGTEYFITAPNSPCTPTPTEYSPLVMPPKESKLSATAEPIVPPLSASARTSSPHRTSSTEAKMELEKCGSAGQASPRRPCMLPISSPANSSSAAGPLSTENHLTPVFSPTKTPTMDLYHHTPVTVSYAPGTVRTEDLPPQRTLGLEVSTVDSSLALVSPTTKPVPTALVSSAEPRSSQAMDTILPATTLTGPVASSHTTTQTDSSLSSVSSPLKVISAVVAPPTHPRSSSDIKINSATGTVDTLTTTDSSLASVSSPTKTNPQAGVEASPASNLTQSKGCVSPKNQSDTSLPPVATTSSPPFANPTVSASSLSANPGPETPKPTDHPHAVEAPSSPVVLSSGDSSDSKQTQLEPTLPADESSRSFNSANTTSDHDEANTVGKLDSDVKDVHGDHLSADTVKLSKESPTDELTTAISSHTKGTVASPSSEDSKEQKSPSAELTKSHPNRYQSSSSPSSVLFCSNLRDDTKVLLEQISANSQNRAAKQNLSPIDDAKEDEEKGPNEKSSQLSTSRLQPRNSRVCEKERDRLITAIEYKRKERKAYSRFETL